MEENESYNNNAKTLNLIHLNKTILGLLPYADPFLFVDELTSVLKDGIVGNYTYLRDSDFYRGHFVNNPLTPGVILTETMAQIGVVCLGIYLNIDNTDHLRDLQIAMTSSEVEYLLPVLPEEKVTVISEKVYYRFGKLKCNVSMTNSSGELVCRGTISGIIRTSIPSNL